MPRVRRELGDVTVTIVGADPKPEVLALAGPGVEVAGWVEDMQPLLDSSRVMVAPLRFGAGMKGKVTQSLANGLPVVTTTIGAEGLGAEDGREMLIADDPDEFAERVARAYRDDKLWSELSVAGQRLVERTCSPATLRERLRELLAEASRQCPALGRASAGASRTTRRRPCGGARPGSPRARAPRGACGPARPDSAAPRTRS